MSSVVLISDLLYQSAGTVFLDGGQVSEELAMVSLAFHLFVVGTVIFASELLCQVKSSKEFLYSFQGKCATHKATKTVYICKRLTLKKYATTRSIAHITIYNKQSITTTILMTLLHHLNSPSWCQNWYPQLARTGMAVFQLPFPTFHANLSGVLCSEIVEATMPMAVESYCDVMISLWL